MKDIENKQAIKRVHNEILDDLDIMRRYLINIQRNIQDIDTPDDVKKKVDDLIKKHLKDVIDGKPDAIIEKRQNRRNKK